ncbi:unnamed protein product, partial [marine sediment metagenome]
MFKIFLFRISIQVQQALLCRTDDIVGRANIIVVGTRDKLNKLEALRVDTGDFSLDQTLS